MCKYIFELLGSSIDQMQKLLLSPLTIFTIFKHADSRYPDGIPTNFIGKALRRFYSKILIINSIFVSCSF